ncbi:hypothetical protein LguiA_017308 [Lonicera macranthoides]
MLGFVLFDWDRVLRPKGILWVDRSLTDHLLQPHQLRNQLDGEETNHFFLVHGGGFGHRDKQYRSQAALAIFLKASIPTLAAGRDHENPTT